MTLAEDLELGTKENVLPHGIHIYKSPITYYSKFMPNIKVFQRQTYKQTDKKADNQSKNYMPPIYQCWGIKIKHYQSSVKSGGLTLLTHNPDF